MTKNNLDELRATLESIRSEKYPDIPPEVIGEIVDIQNEYQDNPTKRQTETRKVIMKFADLIKADEGEQI